MGKTIVWAFPDSDSKPIVVWIIDWSSASEASPIVKITFNKHNKY